MSPSPETPVAENHDFPSSPPPPPSRPRTATSRLFTPIPSSTPEGFRYPDGSPSQLPADVGPISSTSDPSSPPSGGRDESSSTPSLGDLKISKAGIRGVVGTGFRQGCKLLALFIATQPERDFDVWTPDDDDVKGVSVPAANIIHRRLPDEAKGGDVVDFVTLGLALVGYVAKSLHERKAVLSMLALQEAQGEAPQEAGAGG